MNSIQLRDVLSGTRSELVLTKAAQTVLGLDRREAPGQFLVDKSWEAKEVVALGDIDRSIFAGPWTGKMTSTILLTGFGPFPGAPFNPTGPLVTELARRRHPGFRNDRRLAHVFPTSYEAVDRELPALLARERPDVLVMFGLAPRSRHIRIETRARNVLTGVVPDATGHLPAAGVIAPGARAALPLRAPVHRLVAAVRSAGMPAALSGDAGSYLCNYLCWRAGEAAERNGIPRLVAFVHVPNVHRSNLHVSNFQVPSARRPHRPRSRRPPVTLDDLIHAGEAVVRAALAAARR